MTLLKKAIQNELLPLIIKVGAEKFLSRFASSNIVNVMYHGVAEKDTLSFSPRHTPKEQFEEHMRYFSRHFDVVTLEDGFKMKQEAIKPKRKTLTISFDDGYVNNLTNALPLLEKYNLPATFFICGCCVNEAHPIIWADLIAFLRHSVNDDSFEIDGYKFQRCGRYDLVNFESKLSIFDYFKRLEAHYRDDLLNHLDKKYQIRKRINEIDETTWKLMNREQILALFKSPIVTIGSHSTKHYNLGFIEPSYAETDLQTSKFLLESVIQKEVNMLAFPDGNYTSEVKSMAKKIGFNRMLAVNYLLEEDINDPLILNRYGISNTIPFAQNALLLNYSFNTHGY